MISLCSFKIGMNNNSALNQLKTIIRECIAMSTHDVCVKYVNNKLEEQLRYICTNIRTRVVLSIFIKFK